MEEVRPREAGTEVVGIAQNTKQRSGVPHAQEVKTLCVCGYVCLWVCVQMNRDEWNASPQTILFSSKAILFDILSSEILLGSATMRQKI